MHVYSKVIYPPALALRGVRGRLVDLESLAAHRCGFKYLQDLTLDFFMWKKYPTSLWNVRGFTQVPTYSYDNARKGT